MAKISNLKLKGEGHAVRGYVDFIVTANIEFSKDEQESVWQMETILNDIDLAERELETVDPYNKVVKPVRGQDLTPFYEKKSFAKEDLRQWLGKEWTKEEIFATVHVVPMGAHEAFEHDIAFSNIVKVRAA